MAKHKPRKSAPTEYTTDDEDVLMYDVEKELDPDPTDKFVLEKCPTNFPKGYLHSLKLHTRFRKTHSLQRHLVTKKDIVQSRGSLVVKVGDSWLVRRQFATEHSPCSGADVPVKSVEVQSPLHETGCGSSERMCLLRCLPRLSTMVQKYQ
ncbi:hypothetical protein TNCV_968881 [Trichonephila clavipes]|nr:hypothetical protein TNCV_968881 [Trichonephila clavipes]